MYAFLFSLPQSFRAIFSAAADPGAVAADPWPQAPYQMIDMEVYLSCLLPILI